MATEQISSSHIGYLCGARKVAVVRGVTSSRFHVEDMSIIGTAPLGAQRSSFGVVYVGVVEHINTPVGKFGLCDLSAVTEPGIYRVVLPETGAVSYQFTVADGVYHRLPFLFLDFLHEWRAGFFSTNLHRPGTVDDGVRSDNGEYRDVSGGWYDAGDLRKWMAHSTLAALGLFDIAEQRPLPRHAFDGPGYCPNDWLTEAAWGIPFVLKMQDSDGQFFEDVGGGSTARKREGMSWWYENHAGCYADNADNRFTDNVPNTGDERSIRVHYNPIAQYTNTAVLARAYVAFAPHDALLSQGAHAGALAGWAYAEAHSDEYEGWTSVRAWRLCAALALLRAGLLAQQTVDEAAAALLETFDDGLGFWRRSTTEAEPYRGILHSAQPIIALTHYLDHGEEGAHAQAARAALVSCMERYIAPMTATNPYHFMPFGRYSAPATDGDTYHDFGDGTVYRYCMPVNHPQQINHGLSGHWMSWAHGLAYAGQVLGGGRWTELAWAQLEWLTGNNHADVSFISGVGYLNPMPHSRFYGTVIGGFMNGFRGTEPDVPFVDLARDAEWNSTEYWNTPLANCLMALSILLPPMILERRKLGQPTG
jgi:hypothetical protein